MCRISKNELYDFFSLFLLLLLVEISRYISSNAIRAEKIKTWLLKGKVKVANSFMAWMN